MPEPKLKWIADSPAQTGTQIERVFLGFPKYFCIISSFDGGLTWRAGNDYTKPGGFKDEAKQQAIRLVRQLIVADIKRLTLVADELIELNIECS